MFVQLLGVHCTCEVMRKIIILQRLNYITVFVKNYYLLYTYMLTQNKYFNTYNQIGTTILMLSLGLIFSLITLFNIQFGDM